VHERRLGKRGISMDYIHHRRDGGGPGQRPREATPERAISATPRGCAGMNAVGSHTSMIAVAGGRLQPGPPYTRPHSFPLPKFIGVGIGTSPLCAGHKPQIMPQVPHADGLFDRRARQ